MSPTKCKQVQISANESQMSPKQMWTGLNRHKTGVNKHKMHKWVQIKAKRAQNKHGQVWMKACNTSMHKCTWKSVNEGQTSPKQTQMSPNELKTSMDEYEWKPNEQAQMNGGTSTQTCRWMSVDKCERVQTKAEQVWPAWLSGVNEWGQMRTAAVAPAAAGAEYYMSSPSPAFFFCSFYFYFY